MGSTFSKAVQYSGNSLAIVAPGVPLVSTPGGPPKNVRRPGPPPRNMIPDNRFDQSDLKLCNTGADIYLQSTTCCLGLKEFFDRHHLPNKFDSAIENTIVTQFSLGSVSSAWCYRIEHQSLRRFLVACDEELYSLEKIALVQGGRCKLVVSRQTWAYSLNERSNILWSNKSQIDIQFTFDCWKTASGKKARLIAPGQISSPITLQLLSSKVPVKVKIGSEGVAMACIKQGPSTDDTANIDTIEVSFGVKTLTVPMAQITLFNPILHLSQRQESFNEFLNQGSSRLLQFPVSAEEDIIRVYENSRYRILLTPDQLEPHHDDTFSDTASYEEEWVDEFMGYKAMEDDVLSEVDPRAFVILFTYPRKADMVHIVQLYGKGFTIVLLSDEPKIHWLPDGISVWNDSMKRITEG
ncbi:hypothetical protein BDZ45DRAFT_681621 [Acephala macrosclerotiorum]|nr:hypothetical protein BDZ45DRAFT_681621 [Acephala macrosclerotiorum]